MRKFADKRLGIRIRELRNIKGWTQEELAKRTGGSRPQVGRDERTGHMSTGRIFKYAEAFKVVPALITEVLDEEIINVQNNPN